MEAVKEIWSFLRVRKKFWLAPMAVALVSFLLLGMLVVFAGNAGILGPFIISM